MKQIIKKQNTRTFAEIAKEIKRVWTNVCYSAKPYLHAMMYLNTCDKDSYYFCDSAEDIVLHFLCNANTWRGEDARRIKAELKSMIK